LTDAGRAEEHMAPMRHDLAKSAFEEAKKKFEVGMMTRTSLLGAESDLRTTEANLARVRLNLEEIQASSAAPRDEISAPLVGSRDFVSERLRLDILAAQQRLTALQQQLQETQMRVEVGTAGPVALLEVQSEVVRANADFLGLAMKLDLRKRFLTEHLEVPDIERQVQRADLMRDADVAKQRLALAKERLANVHRMFEIGQADQIEVKRAELDVLERQADTQLIAKRLQLLDATKKE
jgi:outer membrane protein TolC